MNRHRSEHRVVTGDARDLHLSDDSVDLVVTSPPYPMIEMWDDVFAELDPEIGAALDAEDGAEAYRRMHAVLDEVWAEVVRVLAPGGTVCVNVGDATRTIDGFRRFPNHATVVEAFRNRGLRALPDVLWRKPTNSAAKFMGSGMLPPNAYVTLEHEYVLVFRDGGPRRIADRERRYESAYFWEERNEWFSDVWTLTGERQALDSGARERTAAFPFELPYRLINMFSMQGDTVLDPFLGTGTTTLAAMASGRNSVGYEREPELRELVEAAVERVPALAAERNRERLENHREFVRERRESGDELGYESEVYDFPVMTGQERELRLPSVEEIRCDDDDRYVVEHGTYRPE